MTPTLMTKQGLEDLIKERDQILNVDIPVANDRLQKARELGDLSENAEYHSARAARDMLDVRVNELNELISNAKTVSSSSGNSVVGIGKKVTVHNGAEVKTYEIVGEFESDPRVLKISCKSPLAVKLMGKKLGDMVDFTNPSGAVSLKILKIE